MKGYIHGLRVGQAVEVGPKEQESLVGDDLDGFMGALRILSRHTLAEPLQGLPLAKPGQSSAGCLPHLRVGIVPVSLETARNLLVAERFPPAETADGGGATGRIPVPGRQEQGFFGLWGRVAPQSPQDR